MDSQYSNLAKPKRESDSNSLLSMRKGLKTIEMTISIMDVFCQEFHYRVFPSKLKTVYTHHLSFPFR